MRSAVTLGMALCLLPLDAAAGAQASVGAQVGYSRSDLGGSGAAQLRSRQGALTGVFLTARLGPALSIRPELLFAQKGGRTLATLQDGSTATFDIELAYFELPVLARAALPRGRFRPVLFAGPAPALQIGCDLQLITAGGPLRATCSEAQFTIFSDWDLGLVAGGGIEVNWAQAALALEARYTAGVRSIVDGGEVRNRAFGLLLALTF
ncbi:MAG: porin family protein [Gemmatimonadales bacterium]